MINFKSLLARLARSFDPSIAAAAIDVHGSFESLAETLALDGTALRLVFDIPRDSMVRLYLHPDGRFCALIFDGLDAETPDQVRLETILSHRYRAYARHNLRTPGARALPLVVRDIPYPPVTGHARMALCARGAQLAACAS